MRRRLPPLLPSIPVGILPAPLMCTVWLKFIFILWTLHKHPRWSLLQKPRFWTTLILCVALHGGRAACMWDPFFDFWSSKTPVMLFDGGVVGTYVLKFSPFTPTPKGMHGWYAWLASYLSSFLWVLNLINSNPGLTAIINKKKWTFWSTLPALELWWSWILGGVSFMQFSWSFSHKWPQPEPSHVCRRAIKTSHSRKFASFAQDAFIRTLPGGSPLAISFKTS